jgi:putative FmdB family regulatory protein
MPIYEYECNACGQRFSALLSISQRDEAEKKLPCPHCGAEHPRRLLSTFASHVGGGASSASLPAAGCDGAGG